MFYTLDYLEFAAAEGNVEARLVLGQQYLTGEEEARKDEKKAFEFFGRAANSGSGYGKYCLGFMYGNGLGVEKDLQKAVIWYVMAASQGDAEYNPGCMY